MVRITFIALLTVTVVCPACTSPEPVTPPVVSAPTQRSPMPTAPWSVIFADASGNSFHLLQTSPDTTPEFEYTPVTPEVSSSGVYSGGMAARGELTPEQVKQIWAQIDALSSDTAAHVDQRTMGTGSFVVVKNSVRQQFIVRSGPTVQAFSDLLAPLKTP